MMFERSSDALPTEEKSKRSQMQKVIIERKKKVNEIFQIVWLLSIGYADMLKEMMLL